jgi:hypothetical protein
MLSVILAAAIAQVPSLASDPSALFSLERTAAGGAAWDRVGEIVERGNFSGQGLNGPYTTHVDVRTGASRTMLELAGSSVGQGCDASGSWSYDNGLLESLTDAADAANCRTQTYIQRNGWWNPLGDPATMEMVAPNEIRVVPRGGNAIDVWFDASTHLISKWSTTDASNQTTTTTYADYRAVEGVMYPFAATTSNGNVKFDTHTAVTSVNVAASVAAGDFARPQSRQTGTIVGGDSTTLPFELDSPDKGHIVVICRVNGSRPLHVVFDTGGSNVVTPQVAREIGLKGTGAVAGGGAGEQQVSMQFASGATLAVGKAELRDQKFAIFPLPASLVHITSRYAIDGVIGYEVLKNFVVSVDYVRHTLTLTQRQAFRSAKAGTAVRFASATIPVIRASIDGVEGAFMVDTGNAFYNTVSSNFLSAHGLSSRFGGSELVQSSGNIGGAIRPHLARASSIAIGPYRIERPVFAVTNTQKGALAGTAFAGNIGQAILTRFDLTFDYGDHTIFMRPNANFGKPYIATRDGMSLYVTDAGKTCVSLVNAGSPAQKAGVAAGDCIVAVAGSSAASGPADVATAEANAQRVTVTVERGGNKLQRTIVLREMVP